MKDDAKRARIPIRRLVFITAVPFLLLGFPISCLWLFLIGGAAERRKSRRWRVRRRRPLLRQMRQ